MTSRSVNYTVAGGNAAPVVKADWGKAARNVGFFGLTATVRGSFTDVGDAGPWKVTVDWGNGRSDSSTRTTTGALDFTSPLYLRDGPFNVTVKICDAKNACGTDTVVVRLRVPRSGLRPSALCVTDSGPSTPPKPNRYTGLVRLDEQPDLLDLRSRRCRQPVRRPAGRSGSADAVRARLQHDARHRHVLRPRLGLAPR